MAIKNIFQHIRVRIHIHTKTCRASQKASFISYAMISATILLSLCTQATAVAQFGGLGERISSAMQGALQRSTPRSTFNAPPFGGPMRSSSISPGTILRSGPTSNPMTGGRIAAPIGTPSPIPSARSSLGREVGQAVIGAAMNALADRGAVSRPPGSNCQRPIQPQTNPPVAGNPFAPPVTVYDPLSSSPTVVATTRVTPSDTVFAGPAPAFSDEDQRAIAVRDAVAKAKNEFRRGSYAECIETIDGVLDIMPQESDLLQFRGFAHFALDDIDSAAADYYDALLTGNAWNWEAVNDLYESNAKYEYQLRRLEQKRKSDPSMSTHFTMGYQYIVLNRLQNSQEELNKALIFQPEEPLMTKLVAVIDQVVASK